MKRLFSILLITCAAGLFACSGGKGDSREQAAPPVPAVVKKAPQVKPVLVEEQQQVQRYVVSGVRDPFQPFELSIPEIQGQRQETLSPLQKLTLSQIEMVGIIWGKQNRALIQDSSGMGFIITEGMLLGENSGIVTRISREGMVVKQHFKDYMGRVNTREVTLSLRKEEGER